MKLPCKVRRDLDTAYYRALLHPASLCRRVQRDRGTVCYRALQRQARLFSREQQAQAKPHKGQHPVMPYHRGQQAQAKPLREPQLRTSPSREEQQAQVGGSPRAQWVRARPFRRARWDLRLRHIYRQAVLFSRLLRQLHHLYIAVHGHCPLTRFIHRRIIPHRHLHLIRIAEAVFQDGC